MLIEVAPNVNLVAKAKRVVNLGYGPTSTFKQGAGSPNDSLVGYSQVILPIPSFNTLRRWFMCTAKRLAWSFG
ncbi:hypothetical protein GCM10028774_62110 [Spirosoma jeollabukense]